MSFLDRYLAGECEAVWQEMTVQDAEDAEQVVTETMRRVLHNLRILEKRLPEFGYRFNAPTLDPPKPVLREANEDDREHVRLLGFVPTSLNAFYRLIGEVDLSQDYNQLMQWPEREAGEPYTPLEMLGEYNPLHISPASYLHQCRLARGAVTQFPIMPDTATNAFYSGDSIYFYGPDFGLDAQLSCEQTFVSYLRQAFRHGGFHGMPSNGLQFPTLPWIHEIASELLPI